MNGGTQYRIPPPEVGSVGGNPLARYSRSKAKSSVTLLGDVPINMKFFSRKNRQKSEEKSVIFGKIPEFSLEGGFPAVHHSQDSDYRVGNYIPYSEIFSGVSLFSMDISSKGFDAQLSR